MMLVKPLNGVHFLWDLVGVEGIECRFVSLELRHIFVVYLALVIHSLENYHSATPITYGKHLALFIECN